MQANTFKNFPVFQMKFKMTGCASGLGNRSNFFNPGAAYCHAFLVLSQARCKGVPAGGWEMIQPCITSMTNVTKVQYF